MSPWIGPGRDDGDLDHQIVEPARTQARQHVHLRPAFDLEDADAVALAEHVVDPRILLRDARQGMGLSVVGLDQIEALADASEHAERQDVDLEDAERVDIVLVPFDEAALRHGAIADGHGFGQRALGQDEAADMLAEMPGHADQLPGQENGPA